MSFIFQDHLETDRFCTTSGVQILESNNKQFHYRRVVFSSHLKSKVGHIHTKSGGLCINLNIVDTPITPTSHTHPSHSQTSRLLTSSLSVGVPDLPVPRVFKMLMSYSRNMVLVNVHMTCLISSVVSTPKSFTVWVVVLDLHETQCM